MKKKKFSSFEELEDLREVLQKSEFDRTHTATRVYVELEDYSELEALEELRRKKRREYANTTVCAVIHPDFSIKEISEELYHVYVNMGMLPDYCIAVKGKRWQIKQSAENLKLRHKFQMEAEGKVKVISIKKYR